MKDLQNITNTLNHHLLNYHKDKAFIWKELDKQNELNKGLTNTVGFLENRIVILERARQVQIGINTKLLKEPIKQPAKSWFSNIFNR